MNHARAFLFKLAFVEVATLAVLMTMAGATVGQALAVGLLLTFLLYVLGDIAVLPRVGNFPAVVVDGVVAFLVAWLAPRYAGLAPVSVTAAVTLALVLSLMEAFFHNQLRRTVPGAQGR